MYVLCTLVHEFFWLTLTVDVVEILARAKAMRCTWQPIVLAAIFRYSLATELEYALFIGHRVDWELTLDALKNSLEIGTDKIRLIDTSASLTKEQLDKVPEGVVVLDPLVPLSFSQMQEFMRKTAMKEGLDVYFWIHADVMLSAGTALKALQSVEAMNQIDPKWGILFFSYDLFCAFSVDAVSSLPWDLAIPHYKGDYDYYQSMEQAKRTMYGNGPKAVKTRPVPNSVPWPKRGSIQHVSNGSVLVREIQNNPKSLAMTEEELWGYFLTDYVGRYIYFFLKWGYAWPNAPLEHFDSVYDSWGWIRIFLRLPSPGINDFWWNVFKVYVAVSLIVLPLVFIGAVVYAFIQFRQEVRRATEKMNGRKAV